MAFRTPQTLDWIKTLRYVAIAAAIIMAAAIWLGQRHVGSFLALTAGALVLLVRWHAAVSGYRCPRCSHEFSISAWRDFLSPHMISTKYLKCPSCNEWDWAEVLVKKG